MPHSHDGKTSFWLTGEPHERTSREKGLCFMDIEFVDDLCLRVRAANPDWLCEAVKCVSGALHKAFAAQRLEINHKPNKTECFVKYRGRCAMGH